MKQPEAIPSDANTGSPVPRFLRGLFRREKPSSDPASAKVVVDVYSGPFVTALAGRRPKILVVDDDAVVLKTLELKLSRAGCEVLTGRDGSQAVTATRKEQPDVLVLDVNFPPEVALAWDGIGVMQWLQRVAADKTPPVIVISGMTDAEVRKRALDAGAVAFLQKPVDHAALVEAINAALRSQQEIV